MPLLVLLPSPFRADVFLLADVCVVVFRVNQHGMVGVFQPALELLIVSFNLESMIQNHRMVA